jgi:hypothetical protein
MYHVDRAEGSLAILDKLGFIGMCNLPFSVFFVLEGSLWTYCKCVHLAKVYRTRGFFFGAMHG